MGKSVTVRLWGTRGSYAAHDSLTAEANRFKSLLREVLLDETISQRRSGKPTLDDAALDLFVRRRMQERIYGGRTTCIEVDCGDRVFVFDMGTGAADLGRSLLGRRIREMDVFFTHFHSDHTQGLPFCDPVFVPDFVISLYSKETPQDLREILIRSLSHPTFPLHLDQLPSHPRLYQISEGVSLNLGSATITPYGLNHPGGVMGYRISAHGKTVVIASDHQPTGALDPKNIHPNLRLLMGGRVDLAYFDAQYTQAEFATVKGTWGHGTPEWAIMTAFELHPKRIVCGHHEPTRTADELDAMHQNALDVITRMSPAYDGRKFDFIMARDGMIIKL